MKIAYLGQTGSHSYFAAQSFAKLEDELIGFLSFSSIIQSIESNHCQLAVLPIHNSLIGDITEVQDELKKTSLKIVEQKEIEIFHSLLAHNSTQKIEDLKVAYSHPKAFLQCQKFMKKNSQISFQNVSDTASGAMKLRDKKLQDYAVIAHPKCSELYQLHIVKKSVSDNKKNFTRFIAVTK